jgi:hypothetical protein
LLEEYEPKIVYNKGIHNTVADAVLRLEYDPSVNQTAESFHTMKVRTNQSRQRQNWMTVLKNWCKLDIDSDNLDSYTDNMMIGILCLHITKKRTKCTLLL